MRPADPQRVHERFLALRASGIAKADQAHAEHLAKIRALKLPPEDQDGISDVRLPKRSRRP
jgi:hypothetical protein